MIISGDFQARLDTAKQYSIATTEYIYLSTYIIYIIILLCSCDKKYIFLNTLPHTLVYFIESFFVTVVWSESLKSLKLLSFHCRPTQKYTRAFYITVIPNVILSLIFFIVFYCYFIY